MANGHIPVFEDWSEGSYGVLAGPMFRDSSNTSTESMLTDATTVTDTSMNCASPRMSKRRNYYSCAPSPKETDWSPAIFPECAGQGVKFGSETVAEDPWNALVAMYDGNIALLKSKLLQSSSAMSGSAMEKNASPAKSQWRNRKKEIVESKLNTMKQRHGKVNLESYREALRPTPQLIEQLNWATGNTKHNIPIAPESDPETDTKESPEHDSDTDSLWDESVSQQDDESLEKKVASVLGPEHAHLLRHVLDPHWRSRQEITGFGTGNSSGSEPVSGSPGQTITTTKTPSTTNTSISGKGPGEGRKLASNGNDDDKGNDDDEGNAPKRPRVEKVPKDEKVAEPLWDRILFKLDPYRHSECGTRAFPFRYLLQHIERSHLECESCGRKLTYNDALKHLSNAKKDPTECVKKVLGKMDKVDFIGISTFADFQDIYNEKISKHARYEKWWRMLSSDPVPDPTHDEVIAIPKSKIKVTLEEGRNMWNAEIQIQKLPPIAKEDQDAILELITKAILLAPVLRRKPRQPRTSSASRLASASTDQTMNWATRGPPWNGIDLNQSLGFSNYHPNGPSNGTSINQTPRHARPTSSPGYDNSTSQFAGYNGGGMLNPPGGDDLSLSPGDNSRFLDQLLGLNDPDEYDISNFTNGAGNSQSYTGGNQ